MQKTEAVKQASNGASDGASEPTPVSAPTREQLALIRDEWLAPLLEEIRHQAQDIANLEVLYRQTVDERDRLRIERDELLERLETQPEPEPAPPATGTERVIDLARQLRTTEGAVVAGIAIALALWVAIGLSMFLALG